MTGVTDVARDEARWQARLDALVTGELADEDARARFAADPPPTRLAWAEREAVQALAGRGRERASDPEGDERLVQAAVDAFLSQETDRTAAPPAAASPALARARLRWGLTGGLVGVGLTAAAAALLLLVRPVAEAPPTADVIARAPTKAPRAPEVAPAPIEPGPVVAPEALALTVREPGGLQIDGAPATPGARVTVGAALTLVGEVEGCVGAGELSLCIQTGSKGRVDDDGALHLEEGAARALAGAGAVHSARVVVAGVAFASEPSSEFTVEVREGGFTARVDEGRMRATEGEVLLGRMRAGDVLAREAPRERAALTAPEEAAVAKESAPRTAAELLDRLRSLRAAGRLGDAARVYEQLARSHPGDPRTRASHVALGQLYLGPLARPKAALRAFDRYLEGGRGDLSEEAMHGKIEALARLGARAREQAAIREFLTRFPASRYAEGLRRRVE